MDLLDTFVAAVVFLIKRWVSGLVLHFMGF